LIIALLGAGFAQGLGLPGTLQITEHIRSLERHWVRGEGATEAPVANVLWKIASAYYDTPTFETLLHLVESMISAHQSRFGFGLPDNQKIAFNAFMDVSPKLVDILRETALESFGHEMMAQVADFLDDAIRKSSIEKQDTIRDFLSPFLDENSRVKVATLNYDDAIERSISNFWDGFTASDPGVVDFDGFQNDHKLEILHLHGSIRFAPTPLAGAPRPTPELIRYGSNVSAKPFRSAPLTTVNAFTQAGERIFTGPMISGLRKTEKLVIQPLGLYHHRFVDGLLRTPRLLCIGYGGWDTYINSAIFQARRIHGDAFRAVYILKTDASEPSQALVLPANHSITYWHEFKGFAQRLAAAGNCLEESGMILITTGFPTSRDLTARIASFLK